MPYTPCVAKLKLLKAQQWRNREGRVTTAQVVRAGSEHSSAETVPDKEENKRRRCHCLCCALVMQFPLALHSADGGRVGWIRLRDLVRIPPFVSWRPDCSAEGMQMLSSPPPRGCWLCSEGTWQELRSAAGMAVMEPARGAKKGAHLQQAGGNCMCRETC